jgi:hypothetical protein
MITILAALCFLISIFMWISILTDREIREEEQRNGTGKHFWLLVALFALFLGLVL